MSGSLYRAVLLAACFFWLIGTYSQAQESGVFDFWLNQAKAGNAEAQARVAYAYYTGVMNTPVDGAKALDWIQRAVAQQNPEAERLLGSWYLEGKIVTKDKARAVALIKLAADHGDAESQRQLGVWYLEGLDGFPKDQARAISWLDKAALQRDTEAEMLMGTFYLNGDGVTKNEERGFAYSLDAAEKGSAVACRNVAFSYANGIFVQADPVLAYQWICIARAWGSDDAPLVNQLASVLTPEQVVQAEQKAQAWLTKGPISELPEILFAGGKSVTLPFANVSGGILLKLRVSGGRELIMLLDTGTNFTMIYPQTAQDLQLASNEYVSASGIGRELKVASITKPFTMDLPGLRINNIRAVCLPFELDEIMGLKVDGILGTNFLAHFLVKIDYIHQTVTLADPATRQAEAGEIALPVTMQDAVPHIQVKLKNNGKDYPVGNFLVDSGMVLKSVSLTERFQQYYPSFQLQKKVYGISLGVWGGDRLLVGMCDSLLLGEVEVREPDVQMSIRNQGVEATSVTMGSIGEGILKRFMVSIDYPGSMLYLSKNAHFDQPFDHSYSGEVLIAKRPDYRVFVVRKITPDSPAEKLGLKEGDVLKKVDNRAVAEFTLTSLRDQLAAAGVHHLVVDRNGQDWEGDLLRIDPFVAGAWKQLDACQSFRPVKPQQ